MRSGGEQELILEDDDEVEDDEDEVEDEEELEVIVDEAE